MNSKILIVLSLFSLFTLCAAWLLNFIPFHSNVSDKKIEHADFFITFDHYKPKKKSINKSVIIMPPTGGKNILDEKYARAFNLQGFDAYIVKSWSNDDEIAYDKELHNRFYGRGLKAINLLVQYIETKGSSSIGLLGSSVGALHGMIATHKLKQISHYFSISGGIDLAGIISHSDQEAMRILRKKRIQTYEEFTEDNYYQKLREYITVEPKNINFDRSSKFLGQVLIEQDATVPTRNQMDMQKKWRPEKVITIKENLLSKIINYPHKAGIILTSFFYEDEIVDFFKTDIR